MLEEFLKSIMSIKITTTMLRCKFKIISQTVQAVYLTLTVGLVPGICKNTTQAIYKRFHGERLWKHLLTRHT